MGIGYSSSMVYEQSITGKMVVEGQILAVKYSGKNHGWNSNWAGESYDMSVLKGISMIYDVYLPNTSFKVGDSSKVHFWSDWLCGDLPLGDSFLALVIITENQESTF